MPQLALLSAGRNNGDNSWSVTRAELENLAYLPPEGADEAHALAVRVIDLDDGSTLGVFDFPVTPAVAGPGPANEGYTAQDTVAEMADNTQLHLLRDELAKAKAALAARETELANAREETGHAEAELSRQNIETETARGRDAGKAELDERKFASLTAHLLVRRGEPRQEADQAKAEVSGPKIEEETALIRAAPTSGLDDGKFANLAAALFARKGEARPSKLAAPPGGPSVLSASNDRDASGDEAEIRRLRGELATLQTTLADRENALVRVSLDVEQALGHWERETQERLSKAEQAWKADAAAQLVAAEAQWQEKSRSALAEARAETEAVAQSNKLELDRQREKLVALYATLADSETALGRAVTAAEEARERWKQETKDALSKAEQEWKADAAARLAAVEAQWQEKSRKALADARDEAGAARDHGIELESNRLRDELAQLKASLADRETALARLGRDTEQARERWRHETEDALSNARAAWKAEEAARAEGNAIDLRRLRDELAQSRASLAEREAALSRHGLGAEEAHERWRQETEEALSNARVAWKAEEAARAEGDAIELRRLRDELAQLKTNLADRENALARLGSDARHAHERQQQQTDNQLLNAEQAWKADAAARLAAVEAQWQERCAKALAEGKARSETAEAALAQLRVQAKSARDRSDIDLGRLRHELATSLAALADRETELAQVRSAIVHSHDRPAPEGKIVLRPNRVWNAVEPLEQQDAQPKRHAVRDIVVAASLAVSAILFYPSIAALIPDSWRSNIAAITGGIAFDGQRVPAPVGPRAAPPAAEQKKWVVAQDVNMRTGPSTTNDIIVTLRRGQDVKIIEQRGNWTLVQIGGENGSTESRQGWIYSSFLKDSNVDDAKPPTEKREQN